MSDNGNRDIDHLTFKMYYPLAPGPDMQYYAALTVHDGKSVRCMIVSRQLGATEQAAFKCFKVEIERRLGRLLLGTQRADDELRVFEHSACDWGEWGGEATAVYGGEVKSAESKEGCQLCQTNYCFICGEEHQDVPIGHGEHWQLPGCPRYNAPNPRRGGFYPSWNSQYSAEDVARLLFEQRAMQYADAHLQAVATDYEMPDAGGREEYGDLHFDELDPRDSALRPSPRRVIDVHDRYQAGDLRRLWQNINREGDVARRNAVLRRNREFLRVLAALRHVVTFRHNVAAAATDEPQFPSEANAAQWRILFAHNVHMLRRRYWRFCRYSNGEELPALRLGLNIEWRDVLRSVLPVQFPGLDENGGIQELRQDIAALVNEHLFPVWHRDPPIPEESLEGLDPAAAVRARILRYTTELVEATRGIVDFRQFVGRLPLAESCLVSFHDERIIRTLAAIPGIAEDGTDAFRNFGADQALTMDLAQGVSDDVILAADGGRESTDTNEQQEQELLTGRYEWLQDMLLSVAHERLRLAQRQDSQGEQDEPPRLTELYHVLSRLEPMARAIMDRFGEWPGAVGDEDEALRPLMQLREYYNYDAGEGPLRPAFFTALELLSSMLALIDRHRLVDGRSGPGGTPSPSPSPSPSPPPTPPSSSGSSSGDSFNGDVPPPRRPARPDEQLPTDWRHELIWIADALIHQQRKAAIARENREPVHQHVQLRTPLLADIYYILQRLAQPNRHPADENRATLLRLRHLSDWAHTTEEPDFHWSDADVEIMAGLTNYLRVAETSDEINPITPEVAPDIVADLQRRLTLAENALRGEDIRDARMTYIDGIRVTWMERRRHWLQRNGISQQQENDFVMMINMLDSLLALAALPATLRDNGSVRATAVASQYDELATRLHDLYNREAIRGVRIRDFLPTLQGIASWFLNERANNRRDLWRR